MRRFWRWRAPGRARPISCSPQARCWPRRFPARKTLLLPHGADIGAVRRRRRRAPPICPRRQVAGFYGSLSTGSTSTAGRRRAIACRTGASCSSAPSRPTSSVLRACPTSPPRPPAACGAAALCPALDGVAAAVSRYAADPRLQSTEAARIPCRRPPIVTTDFPHSPPIATSSRSQPTPPAFTALLGAAADTADGSQSRRARVKGETWEARAADIEAALEQLS